MAKPEPMYVTRDDIIRGRIPEHVARHIQSNVPCVQVVAGKRVVYTPVEYCGGVHHPDAPAHPWRTITEDDGTVIDVPRWARIGFALLDEDMRALEAEGKTEAQAIQIIAERYPGGVLPVCEADYPENAA